jgi:hypothetical protein
MRSLLLAGLLVGLVGPGGFARDARAGATVDLLFTAINGSPIAPTSYLDPDAMGWLSPGDALTIAVMLSNDEPLTAMSFSVTYALQYQNALNLVSVAQWSGVALSENGVDRRQPLGPLSPSRESDHLTTGFLGSFQGYTANLSLPRTLPPGSYQMGTVNFAFNGYLTGPAQVMSGLFNFGIDVTGDADFNRMDARTLFNGAAVWIPEPATAACLGLGLLALGIGRRRGRERTRAKP